MKITSKPQSSPPTSVEASPSPSRLALLAEIERIQCRTLNEQETLLETFLDSQEAQCASEIVFRSLNRGSSNYQLGLPSNLLPWLG